MDEEPTPEAGQLISSGLAVPLDDYIVLDNGSTNSDSDVMDFGNFVVSSSDIFANNEETIEWEQPALPRTSKSRRKSSKSARWKQEEVLIKTLESEFKVTMWTKSDSREIASGSAVSEKTTQSPSKPSSNRCTFEACQKTFRDAPSLRKHMHTHGPKTFICHECGKSFVERSKLKRHHMVHTGEKPYQCWFDGCGKRFSLDFNLRTHVRIHTGVRPYVCPSVGCSKSFTQSANLKSHMGTHSGDRNSRGKQKFG